MRALIAGLVLMGGVLPAQGVDAFFWGSVAANPGPIPCQICVYDGSGVPQMTFPGTANAPPVIVKHPSGTVWVFDATTALITPYTLLGGPGIPIGSPAGLGIAVAAGGNLWTASQGLFGSGTVTLRNGMGTTLNTFGTSLQFPGLPVGDRFGNVWVADFMIGSVQRISQAGATLGPFTPQPGSNVVSLDSDPTGNVWVFTATLFGGSPTLSALSQAGTTLLTLPVPGAVDFDLDGCGRPHVLALGASGLEVRRLAPDGTLLATLTPPTGNYDDVEVDSAGRCWLTDPVLQSFTLIDRDGSFITSNVVGPNPNLDGDRTGTHLVSVLAPTVDTDLDTVSNEDELRLGTDPLDGASFPPALVLQGIPSPGGSWSVSLNLPAQAGRPYVIGASFGNAGIAVLAPDPCPVVPLTADPVLALWLSPAIAPIATGIAGVLDVTGSATTSVSLPADPILSGLTLIMAGLTLDPNTFEVTVTRPLAVTIN